MKKVFLFLFIINQINAQKITLKGKLVNQKTKEPIAYANISFLDENNGISSNDEGYFSFQIEKELLKKKVHISCLNFKDTVVLASTLENNVLHLQPKEYVLEEVSISKKIDKELKVDKYRRKHIKSAFGGRQSIPWIVTKYFRFKEEYNKTPYLKEIVIYFSSMLGRKKSKFRIRLFKIDKISGKPSEDLTDKSIIAFSRKIDGKVKVDISKLDIEFPKEGFFVGLERIHIPFNFYEYTYTMQGSNKKYTAKAIAPSFGAVYTNDTIFTYSQGKWRKFYSPQNFYNGNNLEPAISLTLSN